MRSLDDQKTILVLGKSIDADRVSIYIANAAFHLVEEYENAAALLGTHMEGEGFKSLLANTDLAEVISPRFYPAL